MTETPITQRLKGIVWSTQPTQRSQALTQELKSKQADASTPLPQAPVKIETGSGSNLKTEYLAPPPKKPDNKLYEIDLLGNNSADWDLDKFIEFYEKNKDEVDKIATKTLNFRVKLFDQKGHQYMIRRNKGKMVFKRVSPFDKITKHDLINQLLTLERDLETLQQAMNPENPINKPPEETALSSVKKMMTKESEKIMV